MIYDCLSKVYVVWYLLMIAHKQKTAILMLVVVHLENNGILCAFGSRPALILRKTIERRHKQEMKQKA